MAEIKNNPDQGTEIDYTPEVSDDPTLATADPRLQRHVFPANTGAYSWHNGPQPQLGSVLEIVKKD